MQSFVYSYPTKVYFGQGAARQALEAELGSYGPNVLLAYGGGSVIDCCKIVAAQAKTDEDVWEMEFTHRRFPAEVIPMGAVVTASGTGAPDPAPRPPADPGFTPFPHPDTIPTVPARRRRAGRKTGGKKMRYELFEGRTRLSKLGMGAMRLPQTAPGFAGPIDEPGARASLDRCMAAGVNYYDTAYIYHGGNSERVLGRALARYLAEMAARLG